MEVALTILGPREGGALAHGKRTPFAKKKALGRGAHLFLPTREQRKRTPRACTLALTQLRGEKKRQKMKHREVLRIRPPIIEIGFC